MASLVYKRIKLLAPDWLVDPMLRLAAAKSVLFSNGYPLTDPVSEKSSPFYVIGSGRSGNTLLRSMLCSHPDVGVPPEFGGFRSAFRKFKAYSHLQWRVVVGVVLAEMADAPSFSHWKIDMGGLQQQLNDLPQEERSFASIVRHVYSEYLEKRFPGCSIWGDKTPANSFNLTRLEKVFPAARYIHMLRDGRDVVASCLQAGLSSVGTLKEASYHWRDAVHSVRRSAAKRVNQRRYLEVRYEDLVTDPKRELIRICEFLGIAFSVDMLDFNKVVPRLGDTHLGHHKNVSKPISASSVGKWKHAFSDNEYSVIMSILGKELTACGYSVNGQVIKNLDEHRG